MRPIGILIFKTCYYSKSFVRVYTKLIREPYSLLHSPLYGTLNPFKINLHLSTFLMFLISCTKFVGPEFTISSHNLFLAMSKL